MQLPQGAALVLQVGIEQKIREEHVWTEFNRATSDASKFLPLNDFMVYYHTEVAAVLPVGRGVYNPKGRKLDILDGGAWPASAMHIGARFHNGELVPRFWGITVRLQRDQQST